MLSFDIRSLQSRAVIVDTALPSDDPVWEEGDPTPDGSVDVGGRLSAAGPSRFYWHGRIAGDLVLPCRRCLLDVRVHVDDEAHLIFAETGDEDTDDPDVYQFDPSASELDLRPAIRELWLVAAPSFAVCREDCKGLCPRCGTDLNAGPCDCPTASDSPWDALRKLDRTSK
jgi:uncharacterized protein